MIVVDAALERFGAVGGLVNVVNQVNPGWMETESEHRTQVDQVGAPENWLELAAPGRPLGRLVQPWEVANAIVYCLSPDAGIMTGKCIDIDQSVQGAGDPPLPTDADTIQLPADPAAAVGAD